MFFLWFDWAYGFGEEDHRGEVTSRHIQGTRCIADGVDLDPRTEWRLPGFS